MRIFFSIVFVFSTILGQVNQTNNTITQLADSYYTKALQVFPYWGYFIGVTPKTHDTVKSNDIGDIKKWESFEDSLYAVLNDIDEKKITSQTTKINYWILREVLQSAIENRVCKRYLWNVTHRYGWYIGLTYIAELQPIGTDELRDQAFTRWKQYPAFVDQEITNLQSGIKQGYTMPKEIVHLVIDQIQKLLNYKIEDSPFMSPAKRDGNKEFYKNWETLITKSFLPALQKYQIFLKDEYLEQAREDISVLSLPNGYECYKAYIRKYTTTNKSGEELFVLGKRLTEANEQDAIEIGRKILNSNNFTEIIELINNDSSNYFVEGNEILTYCEMLLSESKEISKDWFNVLPSQDVTLKPYAPHEGGVGSYEKGTEAKPPYFRINLKNPSETKRSDTEILTFHEAYPGHHMQKGIEKDIVGIHPISKLVSFTSYNEGWARYAEQLSEEMGLYHTQYALIERRAWPARGMVADVGIHIYDWSKEQAIEYMMKSGMAESTAATLYLRSIVSPAQLTSYDTGGEVIKGLRKMAEEKLGDKFDIKEFHTKILENGSIPLIPLQNIIEEWIVNKTE